MKKARSRAQDAKLLHAIRDGDTQAFEWLYDRYAPGLMGFISQRTPNRADAEELLQETFLRMLRDRHFEPTAAGLGTYLYVIARNLCLSHIRDQHPGQFSSMSDVVVSQTLPLWTRESVEPDEYVGQRQQLSDLARALELLPDTQREAFLLRHHHGMSYQEIAEICDSPVGTAKSRVHLAIMALRVAMQERVGNVTSIEAARRRKLAKI